MKFSAKSLSIMGLNIDNCLGLNPSSLSVSSSVGSTALVQKCDLKLT